MRGGRLGFASVSVLFLSMLAACGGDRGAGASARTSDTLRSANPDTAAAAVGGRSDTSATAAKPDTIARATPPKKTPAPRKPASPAEPKPAATPPRRAATEPFGSQTPAAPAETTPTAAAPAEAGAPLRDAYHQAPLDTVSQQVYDGWKQFNLNCARCHGEDVQGTTIAPHLIVSVRPDGSIPTKELFMQTVCAGRPEKGMPAWCPLGLEMGKIEAIYLYVKGRSEGKIHPGRPALRQ